MKRDFLFIPSKPEKPNFGRPPKLVRKSQKEREKHGYGSDSDSWRWERCGHCHVIIGKDYGSYSHTCEEGRAYKEWMQPQWEYEKHLKEYERAVYLNKVKDRIIAIGMDEESAIAIVARAATNYDPEKYLWDTLWFLEKIEAHLAQ